MDIELAAAISGYVSERPELRLLERDEAEVVRAEVSRAFALPEPHVWWWEHLASSKSLHYVQGDGLKILSTVLPRGAEAAYLFVTDDEPWPWLCVLGPPQALVELVGQSRFFEFFVVDRQMGWIVFDTHHNSLVGRGESLTMWPATSND